jgi:site-specific recombinase XerD
MASTGMRIGALPELRIGDIRKIDEFNLYIIWVYNRSNPDRYFTFCTPECAAIDTYLEYRRRLGEVLKDRSPLIRERFNIDNPFIIQSPRPASIHSISRSVDASLRSSGVNVSVNLNQEKTRERQRQIMLNSFVTFLLY